MSRSYLVVAGRHRAGASLDELRVVYERRLPDFRRVAAGIVGDREVACDVVQDAFVRAVRLRGSFVGRGPLEAWVWRIVVNVARDRSSSRHRDEPVAFPLEAAGVDERDERAELVRLAVEQLPERQRLALFLRYYADLDYASIASALDIKGGTVAATLNAAHKRVQELLSEVA